MSLITVPAHFDGERILLDEPFDLPQDAKLLVTVLDSHNVQIDEEREDWVRLSLQNLARAYGDNEPEYTADHLKSVAGHGP